MRALAPANHTLKHCGILGDGFKALVFQFLRAVAARNLDSMIFKAHEFFSTATKRLYATGKASHYNPSHSLLGGSMRNTLVLLVVLLSALPLLAQGAPPQAAADQPYIMEYYYKVQWGHQ